MKGYERKGYVKKKNGREKNIYSDGDNIIITIIIVFFFW